ncbi:MAG: sugar-binding domain-containing protein [Stygiobacter sp.]|jgi:hypothetical protein
MDKLFKTISLFFLLIVTSYSQIKVTSLFSNENISNNYLFGISETRNVSLINDNWKVYQENSYNFSTIKLPAIFSGDDQLTFERKIDLTQNQIDNQIIKIGFLGINNFAEIYLNGNNIYNHNNGILPFEVILPKDFLRSDKSNKIVVKVKYKIDSENTIPVKQRFLFPEIQQGIIRDVYLKFLPKIFISQIDFANTLNSNATNGKINFNIRLENYLPKPKFGQTNDVLISVNIFSPTQQLTQISITQALGTKEIIDSKFEVNLSNIIPWSPDIPNNYNCVISIIKDGIVLDKQTKTISFFNLQKSDNSLLLNGNPFSIKGTTYLLNETKNPNENIYARIKNDLQLIKQTGFNSVRFSKSFPHPYALQVCNEIGLLALIEVPLNSIPERFFKDNNYKLKIASFENEFLTSYSNFSNTFLFGIGSGFLPNSILTENYISFIIKGLKKSDVICYASFSGLQNNLINSLDFYGLELFSPNLESIKNAFEKLNPEIKNSLLITELTYPNYKGLSNGYLVNNSLEAQAKYFDDVLNLLEDYNINRFFINTFFNYSSFFESFYAGYTGDQTVKISVLSKYRNTNNIVYKTLYSKLNNGSKVAIPIGIKKEDNPIEFILIALVLALFMAVLVNSKRKFREDATRALLKSYNFFQDIRDHRITSLFHTSLLLLLISATFSLLVTIIIFYFRNNLLLEFFISSFASRKISTTVSFLAWNPKSAFVILFLFITIKFLLLTLIIKIASFFVKTRVSTTNIFYILVWAYFPVTLLLPLELILHKILLMNIANPTILVLLILTIAWLFFRLLKGISIIFDVSPFYVYLYSFTLILTFIGVLLLKYQITHSIIYYFENAVKQYNSLI